MLIIKFSSGKDYMKGLKLIIGKYPFCPIDGMTYGVPIIVKEILDNNDVKYNKINNGQYSNIINDFRQVILGDQ